MNGERHPPQTQARKHSEHKKRYRMGQAVKRPFLVRTAVPCHQDPGEQMPTQPSSVTRGIGGRSSLCCNYIIPVPYNTYERAPQSNNLHSWTFPSFQKASSSCRALRIHSLMISVRVIIHSTGWGVSYIPGRRACIASPANSSIKSVE